MLQDIPKMKKKYVVAGMVIAVLVIIILIANFFAGSIAEKKIRRALQISGSGYLIDFDRAKINFLTMTVIIKDLTITPDSALLAQYKGKESVQKSLYKVEIPVLRLRHIDAVSILGTKQIDIREIIFNKMVLTIITGGGKHERHRVTEEQVDKGININRIALPEIGGVGIGSIKFNAFTLYVVNLPKEDTVLVNKGADFTLDNLSLIKNPIDTNTFRLVMKDMRLDIEDEEFDFSTKDYNFSFSHLNFSLHDKLLHIENTTFSPKRNMYAMASAMKFRDDVFNVVIDVTDVYLGDIKSMILNGSYDFPLVKMTGLKLFVLRNRSLPFDESKRPLLPNDLLKNMTTGLNIDSIIINKSQLVYEESNSDKEPTMKVSLDRLKVLVTGITSVADSMKLRPMKMKIRADLQNQIPMEVNFTFPLASVRDTFSYYGSLGGGAMSVFNPMLESAAGVRFSSGDLESIKFHVRANNTYAMGSMTMLYHNLTGTVLRKDGKEDNKLLSWIANQVLKSANPAVGDQPREVPIYFDRVMYKGFGNFAFKPLLSGILATTIPTFDKSNQNSIDEVKGTTRRDLRKRKRDEKRKNN